MFPTPFHALEVIDILCLCLWCLDHGQLEIRVVCCTSKLESIIFRWKAHNCWIWFPPFCDIFVARNVGG